MLNVKKFSRYVALDKVVTNVEKSYWQYYTAIIAVLIVILVTDAFFYKGLTYQNKEKEIAFIDGSEISIRNFILNDLKLIFDKHADLNQLSILKNYSQITSKKETILIIGNVLYISRGQDQMIFDLQPLILLVNSILAQNFCYQITLNYKILITNIEDSYIENYSFSSTKKYQISEENPLIIKLNLREDSEFVQTNLQQFNRQIFAMAVISILSFLALIPLIIYIIRKIQKFNELNKKILILKEESELNLKYAKVFQYLVMHDGLSTIPNIIKTNIDQINIAEFIEEIRIFVLAYNIKVFYNFEMRLVSDVLFIDTKFDIAIFKQIIISLLFNVLYFMRGGTHIRKFSIKFQNDSVVISYDSFAANEKHMCQWSEDIFQHLGNPYVLDCKKIFQLIENCGLSCEVVPQQGNNIITIFNLNKNGGAGRVIKFNGKFNKR